MSGTTPSCGCATFSFPKEPCNPAGLSSIAYRTGDFVSFRYQLLRPLPGETELTAWRPGATGDLAVQMMEWWAYLGDILTFYNERIANEAYLGTALLAENINHLVQLLGYRPKPALGSKGTLAALLSSGARPPITVPAGLRIQSKPGPGEQPQIFEVDQTTIGLPDMVIADVVPDNQQLLDEDGQTLWLAGKITTIKIGDRYLLIEATAISTQAFNHFAWIKVTATAPGTTPLGDAVTKVTYEAVAGQIPSGAAAEEDYVLLNARLSSPLWSYPKPDTVITSTTLDLAGIARGVGAGSLMLLDLPNGYITGALGPTPVIVKSYAEIVWYANGDGFSFNAGSPPNTIAPIAIPHAEIGFAPALTDNRWNNVKAQVTVRWNFTPVGQLVPVNQSSDYVYNSGGGTLVAGDASPNPFPDATTPIPVLVEDANGVGAATTLNQPGGASDFTFGTLAPDPANGLASPIDVLFNQVAVSRGKTVPAEILGGGNPSVAGQDFTLTQAPVTYFFDPASVSGPNFSSTVEVSVDGVQWREVQSFYGQPANAQVFMLREDDGGKTHVSFGDGVNGALLPTGANNVTATYRFGAGAAAPSADSLTVVLTPTPGLKGVRNPLPPTGGADADPPSQLRTLAPRSVLTFNRAVSLDDYAAIARTRSNVTQATANYAFDAQSQRPVVVLWVAGDANARSAAAEALAGTEMPNQNLVIQQADPVVVKLSLTYVRDQRYADGAVRTGLMRALADPGTGLFAPASVGIGQPIYESEIAAVCLKVLGVTAIQNVTLRRVIEPLARRKISRFVMRSYTSGTSRDSSVQRFTPGQGAYFSLPNDTDHVVLTEGPAS